jgi:hypothetical protein
MLRSAHLKSYAMLPLRSDTGASDLQGNYIMKCITFIFVVAALTSCATSDQPDFTEMSQRELRAYNLSVATDDRVYCADVQVNPASRRTRYLSVTARPPYTGLSTPREQRYHHP